MSKSKTTASYEIVYNTLRKRILHLELPPGSIVSEIETAKEFSVSRTPVRDAFKALVNEGLLEVKPHVGTFVTLIDMNEISDILYIRETMEKAIINELAVYFGQWQEFKLQHILNHQKQLLEDSLLSAQDFAMKFAKSDNDFHNTLFALAGKERLLTYFYAINSQYQRFRTFLNFEDKTSAEKLYNEHQQLLVYIKNKDVEKLNSLLTHHIYDGFNSKINLIYEYPNYFNPL